jgi:hypothetical protein
LPQNSKVTILRDQGTGYWCFKGSAESYSITFPLDNRGLRSYRVWLSKEKTDAGFINAKDFGAKGDGSTDDTDALRNAIAFVAAKQGGTLFFPPGDYLVGGNAEFDGLALPPGIVIQGSSGMPRNALHNYFEPKQFSQVRVRRANQTVFRIGEGVTGIKIKNISLRADVQDKTYGLEAVGDYRGTPSSHVGMEDVAFDNFDIGLYVHNADATNFGWQIDIISVERCLFIFNRTAGIWVESYNSEWHVSNSTFLSPAVTATNAADGIKIKVGGAFLIEHCYGGGLSYDAKQRGGDFIDIDVSANVTILNCSSERATNSLTYAAQSGTGGYSYTLTLINNSFIDPVRLRRVMFVSTGNTYGGNSVQTGDGVQIYSIGDRFCYDATQGFAPNENPPRYPCGPAGQLTGGFQGAGKIVFQTGQLRDTSLGNSSIAIPERPTVIGTETQFDAPARLPSFRANGLPPNRAAGTMLFCADCRKDTSPCSAGGDGALAISIGGRWDCK